MTAKAKSKASRGFTHFDVHGRPACGQGGTAIILSKDFATCMRCQKQYAYQTAMHRKRERESQSNQAGEVRHPSMAHLYDYRISAADAARRIKQHRGAAEVAAAIERRVGDASNRPYYVMLTVAVGPERVVEKYRYRGDGKVVGVPWGTIDLLPAPDFAPTSDTPPRDRELIEIQAPAPYRYQVVGRVDYGGHPSVEVAREALARWRASYRTDAIRVVDTDTGEVVVD